MRNATLGLICLLLPAAAAAQEITKDDIIKLHNAGCSDGVILTYLDVKGATVKLSADEIAELKGAGLSDRVISEILKGPVARPNPPPPPRRVTVVQPAPVVVYERPIYYDPWPYSYHGPYWGGHHGGHFSFGFGHHGHHSSFSFGHHW